MVYKKEYHDKDISVYTNTWNFKEISSIATKEEHVLALKKILNKVKGLGIEVGILDSILL